MPNQKNADYTLLRDVIELLASCSDNDAGKKRVRSSKTIGSAVNTLTILLTGIDQSANMSPAVKCIHMAITRLASAYAAKSYSFHKFSTTRDRELGAAKRSIDGLKERVRDLEGKLGALQGLEMELRQTDEEIKDFKASVRALRKQLPIGFV